MTTANLNRHLNSNIRVLISFMKLLTRPLFSVPSCELFAINLKISQVFGYGRSVCNLRAKNKKTKICLFITRNKALCFLHECKQHAWHQCAGIFRGHCIASLVSETSISLTAEVLAISLNIQSTWGHYYKHLTAWMAIYSHKLFQP